MLADVFPPAVTQWVRLHVAAKPHLCATDPAEFHREAVRVRRRDDAGKTVGVQTSRDRRISAG